jgi:hypothetical protein
MADTYNHERFLRWAARTPREECEPLFTPAAQAAIDNANFRPSPTLSPDTTIELLIAAGELVEEADGRLRRKAGPRDL